MPAWRNAAFEAALRSIVVGRCRLVVSNPVLKAPVVSALEAWKT